MLLNMLRNTAFVTCYATCFDYEKTMKHVEQQVTRNNKHAFNVTCYIVLGEILRKYCVEQHVTKNRTGSIFRDLLLNLNQKNICG